MAQTAVSGAVANCDIRQVVTACDHLYGESGDEMPDKRSMVLIDQIEPLIIEVRNHKVILDNHLAALYDVPTKRLNEQVRRNRERFPADFNFQLTEDEAGSLRSQNATLKPGRGQHRKYLPYAFTFQTSPKPPLPSG